MDDTEELVEIEASVGVFGIPRHERGFLSVEAAREVVQAGMGRVVGDVPPGFFGEEELPEETPDVEPPPAFETKAATGRRQKVRVEEDPDE